MIETFAATLPAPLGGPGDDMERFYAQHAPALQRYALMLSRDPAVAEDVVQEAMVRLTVEMRDGRQPDNIRAWLFRVAANLITSRGRREQVATRHQPALVERDVAVSAESIVLGAERSAAIRAAVDSLPPSDRAAVLLAAQGYRGPEIAMLIGRTEGATRTLLCRARSKLRTQMLEAGIA